MLNGRWPHSKLDIKLGCWRKYHKGRKAVLNVKAVVAAFNQDKALVEAFSVIVQLHRFAALLVMYVHVEMVIWSSVIAGQWNSEINVNRWNLVVIRLKVQKWKIMRVNVLVCRQCAWHANVWLPSPSQIVQQALRLAHTLHTQASTDTIL